MGIKRLFSTSSRSAFKITAPLSNETSAPATGDFADQTAKARVHQLRVARTRINQRVFEVGPTPKKWPAFAKFQDFAPIDPDHVLRSIVRGNRGTLALSIIGMSVLFLGSALTPWAVGILLDSGLERGLTTAIIPGLLLTVGLIIVRSWAAVSDAINSMLYFRGAIGSSLVQVQRYTGIRSGGKQQFSSGEIVSATEGDSRKVGMFLSSLSAAISAFISFGVVVFLMIRTSVPLGLLVGIGLPILLVGMSVLVRPLQNRLKDQREERSKLTTLGTDAVVGLRVLRGMGGEDEYNARYEQQSVALREAGIRAALVQSILGALSTAIPAIYTAVVISIGLWFIYHGNLSRGELVSFFGYMAFLGAPVSTATQLVHAIPDARVGAERMGRILKIEPLTSDENCGRDAEPGSTELSGVALSSAEQSSAAQRNAEQSGVTQQDAVPTGTALSSVAPGNSAPTSTAPQIDWKTVDLLEPASGTRVIGGQFTVLVGADPNMAAQIAEKLARVDDDQRAYVVVTAKDVDDQATEDQATEDETTESQAATGKTAEEKTIDLCTIALRTVRQNIVLSQAIAQLFQGRIRSNLAGANADDLLPRPIAVQMADTGDGMGVAQREHTINLNMPSSEAMRSALFVADALDIIESDEGLDARLSERGRNLSGGQRQRLALARAVLTNAPILVLVEPTSAVDSHTEARIAQRLQAQRLNQTTVVVSSSPIMLNQADRVVFIGHDGTVAAAGTHEELLKNEHYYQVVHRAAGEEE
ncbi:ABC-type multidrug transport system fused ATPase/permease subunit [Arcanobacterium pluranimalium]|uniref:ABC transporter transmembrane domain-containing protein n=1 Tax=Arcanobacterium pluranimalium TaxID=108028 RepID=UPI001956BCDB|nr:ABC transporter ATP-binding protein [Arcanobacterium pluranimalium]MBM7824853.1 ABC-type multidrug transport system fused ATPase/permease subunit [Arcanobacterium pluranimalium]